MDNVPDYMVKQAQIDRQAGSSALVVSRWIRPGSKTFLEVASMVAFLPTEDRELSLCPLVCGPGPIRYNITHVTGSNSVINVEKGQ